MTVPAWVLIMPLRVFLVAGWLRAVAEKFDDEQWWSGGAVRGFLQLERANALPFVRPLMDGVLTTQAPAVAVVVALGQVAIGVGIATGWFIRAALWAGVVLNVTFIACGRVNPSAFYLVMEVALLVALAEQRSGRSVLRPRLRAASIAALLVAAAALLPFVRSMRPATLIGDPAAMLSFVLVIAAAANAARWGLRDGSGVLSRFATVVVGWSYATNGAARRRVEDAALPDAGGRSILSPPEPVGAAIAQEVAAPGAA
jgi:hypothetical protein